MVHGGIQAFQVRWYDFVTWQLAADNVILVAGSGRFLVRVFFE
jgi:hypothetical protein